MREYKNDHLIVYWYPEQCAHPGTCVRLLPKVFDVNRRPWVDINAASPEEIIKAIDQCPSGALKYSLPAGSKVDPALAHGPGSVQYPAENPPAVRIKAVPKGPLWVEGPAEVVNLKGEVLQAGGRLALCSCGKTGNHPFCDGSHRHA